MRTICRRVVGVLLMVDSDPVQQLARRLVLCARAVALARARRRRPGDACGCRGRDRRARWRAGQSQARRQERARFADRAMRKLSRAVEDGVIDEELSDRLHTYLE
jgi:hypothetical protein